MESGICAADSGNSGGAGRELQPVLRCAMLPKAPL
jgi:hypothetical protein